METRKRFRQLLTSPGIIRAAGVGDPGYAKLVEEAGFPAVYMSGAYVNYTYGLPDGILTRTEIVARAASIADRVAIPLIIDADEGYGGPLEIMRTVHEFERAGVAALHIEDMANKKYGAPLPIPDMIKRLKAASEARSDPDLVIIARTDSMAPWRSGYTKSTDFKDECLRRGIAYAEAGADVVMVMAPDSAETLQRLCSAIPKPVMVTMGVWPFNAPAKTLESLGIKIVLFPTYLQIKSAVTVRKLLNDLFATGQAMFTDEDRQNRDSLNKLLGSDEVNRLRAKYS